MATALERHMLIALVAIAYPERNTTIGRAR
jgi:hypothetical protein